MPTTERAKAQSHLDGHHQQTQDAIFQNPTSQNLAWHDVRSLLSAIANFKAGQNDAFQMTRNGTWAIFPPPKHKDFALVEEVLAIRHFLEQSSGPATSPTVAPGGDLLVVIDHRETKVYRAENHGAVPQTLVPYDPHGFGRHLHSHNPETAGKRHPERKSDYESIAKTLRGAGRILIFGHGSGESSAMDCLLADLKHHHRDLAEHVIGSVVVDEHHQTEGQLLAQARELFAANSASPQGDHAHPASTA
jgi:hypothetical protein